MDLDNLVKTVVHHFLIRRMTYLGRRDEFPMVSVLVYVMHTGQEDVRLSIVIIHQTTILHGLSTLRRD